MQVRIDKDGAVTTAWLGADAGGAFLDADAVRRLTTALTTCADDPASRLFVLRSTAGCFCDGMGLQGIVDGDGGDLDAGLRAYADLLLRLWSLPRPTLCLLDGDARGGGVALAAATDHLAATRRSGLSLPEISLGITPAVVLTILSRRLPPLPARAWVLAGGGGAVAAHARGVVDEVVDDADGLERVLRARRRQARRLAPHAVAGTKAHVDALGYRNLREDLAMAVARTATDLERSETRNGLGAFLAGDHPRWWPTGAGS